ncbi:hypothetical protein GALL_256370 [mine drainage metagenome]|uniref:Uncharacterized protein n=1 Tax=mine drainage metagenome TaxID=410659 RepID=A0A1J5R8S2_9ZZZZ
MFAEITLPAGTTKVTVREIPYLLSKAIHPDLPETTQKIVSYLHKQSAENMAIPASRTEELTDDEWAMLHAIWHHLPPFRQGMTESEWVQYAEAFENAKYRPEWGLMVYWRNRVTETKILQIDAEAQHKDLLNTAISNGEITPFNHAQVPCPNYAGEALMNAFITVEDFKKYVTRFPAISVKEEAANFTGQKPVQVSKAPAPISPIRGSYIPKSSNNERLPRWGKWRLMTKVTLWEAVALSLNIEPEKVKRDENAWMGADHPFDEGDSFNDRLAVIRQHSSNRTYFPTPCILNIENWYECGLKLDEFASWCGHVKYDIPRELATMAQVVLAIAPIEAAPIAQADTTPTLNVELDQDKLLAALFDPVPVTALEKMFPASGKWKGWAERAARNQLRMAKEGRAKFNPYKAGIWFMKNGNQNWDLARCHRVLRNNLPPRSMYKADLLGGADDI